MSVELQIREFYSKIKFPGTYSLDDIKFYDEGIYNPYLKILNDLTNGSKSVLDIGCGTGFITNVLARQNPKTIFTSIDFSDSIDYAREFTKKNRTKNIIYYKQDFLEFKPTHMYDLVICMGVIHHIPKYKDAVKKIKEMSSSKLAIGVYNPYGKLAKKFFPINYRTKILYADQEECPFELTFSDREMKRMFNEYKLENVYPSLNTRLVDFNNVFNYNNGGLTLYTWRK